MNKGGSDGTCEGYRPQKRRLILL